MSLSTKNEKYEGNSGAGQAMVGTVQGSMRSLINQAKGINQNNSVGYGIPKHVSNIGVSLSNASAGATSSLVVTFSRDTSDRSFSGVHLYVKGYLKNQTPVRVASGTDSPITCVLNNTGEPINVIVQAFGNGGAAALTSAPTAGSRLPTGVGGGFSTTTITQVTQASGAASLSWSTASLAPAATENKTLSLAKTFVLFRVTATTACRLRLYQTDAARTADSGRLAGRPVPGTPHGLIGEWALDGSTAAPLDFMVSPTVLGSNNDASRSSNIYAVVANIGAATTTISITLHYVSEEA